MKHIWLAISLFVIACNNAPKPEKHESKHKKLLAKYKNKSFDTLKVYSSDNGMGAYSGVPLDSTEALLFPPEARFEHSKSNPTIFAVCKFSIDSNTFGLITRTPSEYVSSSIKLFYFDKTKDTLTSYVELAENWGDAGDMMEKESWIICDRKSRQTRAFMHILESHDHSVEDEKDTTVDNYNYYYLLNISKNADTLSRDSSSLLKQYRHLK